MESTSDKLVILLNTKKLKVFSIDIVDISIHWLEQLAGAVTELSVHYLWHIFLFLSLSLSPLVTFLQEGVVQGSEILQRAFFCFVFF